MIFRCREYPLVWGYLRDEPAGVSNQRHRKPCVGSAGGVGVAAEEEAPCTECTWAEKRSWPSRCHRARSGDRVPREQTGGVDPVHAQVLGTGYIAAADRGLRSVSRRPIWSEADYATGSRSWWTRDRGGWTVRGELKKQFEG